MSTKTLIWIGLAIGGTIGGFVPMLWNGSLLGLSSVFFSAIGSLAGIYFGYKLGQYF